LALLDGLHVVNNGVSLEVVPFIPSTERRTSADRRKFNSDLG